MAAKANKSDLNNETPVKRGRGRPKGSVTNKQKQGAYNIFKRNIKADSLVKSIGVVADRIKDYKREERLTKAKTIDITPTKIEE